MDHATFGGLPEADGFPAEDLFLHNEGVTHGLLAMEDVFGGGNNFPTADNGEFGFKEELLEASVLVAEASVE